MGAQFDDGDRVDLEVSVDRAAPPAESGQSEADYRAVMAKRKECIAVMEKYAAKWRFGDYFPVYHQRHLGLVGQWIDGWQPASDTEVALVLEDDMQLSPLFYRWLKSAVCSYYLDKAQYDPHLFGISLQNQHTIVGQSTRAAVLAILEERAHAAANNRSAEPVQDLYRYVPLSARVPSGVHLYRYQLLGTWGALFFPRHWHAFSKWYDEKTSSASHVEFAPCVPFLESSQWWRARPHSVWSQWFIRFVFEKGWYSLYGRWADGERALARNFREAGENYKTSQGPREALVESEDDLNWSFPPLRSLPLYDFHFTRIDADPIVLSERQLLVTKKHASKPCLPFRPKLPADL
jgi:hypothetical protein